jgi:hypothetical protein
LCAVGATHFVFITERKNISHIPAGSSHNLFSFRTRGYKSDKIAIPNGIDFSSAFPSDHHASSWEKTDSLITLVWGYDKVGTYQGHASAWTHTCSVHVKTRTHQYLAGTLRDTPALHYNLSHLRLYW